MWKVGLLKKGENDKKKKKSWVQGCENGPISLSRTPLITTAGVLCEGVPGDGGVDRAEEILGRTQGRTFSSVSVSLSESHSFYVVLSIL